MLRPRSNYYERSVFRARAGNCSVNLRRLDTELAHCHIGDMLSWLRGEMTHVSHTVIAIITAVQYLENNPGLNDCENKSKLCTSGAALMIINKHFKRAALTMSGQLLARYYWAVNGQHNEYTNPFKPSDLEFWYIYVLAALLLHLIYSQNCFKCLEDNITVHKATLLFVDIQIHNTRRTTCDQNNFWMQYFQHWWFIYSSVWLNGSCWEWNWLYSRLEHCVDTTRGC